jgi:hypothetical protein
VPTQRFSGATDDEETCVFLDEPISDNGGGFYGPSCRACRQPIRKGERSTRVEFSNDPTGDKGLTGEYHIGCHTPFASMAHIINLKPWR